MERMYREGEFLSKEEKLELIGAFCNSVLHNEVRSLKIESEVGHLGLTGVQTVTIVLRPNMEEKVEAAIRRQSQAGPRDPSLEP